MRTPDALGSLKPQARASSRSGRRLTALRHIRAVAEIGEAESEFVLQGAGEVSIATAGTELFRLGVHLSHPRIVLSGWAGLSVILADGRRQLLDFALPGDLIGFSLHTDAQAKASVICLTPVESVRIPALAGCLETPERFPGLVKVLHKAQDQFENRLLNQIVRNGCQTAQEKLCSLLLELHARLAQVGLAEQHGFELPISQVVIADALGLSPVHVNRTFQHLKRERIIQSEGHRLTILNPALLRRLAGQLRLPRTAADVNGSDRIDALDVRPSG